jgi:hypothetical protein
MLRRLRKGQSTAEYAIVIGLVIAAAVAMQVYVKRGIQGKMKDASDYVDSDASGVVGTTKQYEPNYMMETTMVSTRNASENATTTTGGGVSRAIVGTENNTRTGTTTILAP